MVSRAMSGQPSSVISWKRVKRARGIVPNQSLTCWLSRRWGSRVVRRVMMSAMTYSTPTRRIMNQPRARRAPQSACTSSTSFDEWRSSRRSRRIRSIRTSRTTRNIVRRRSSNCCFRSGRIQTSIMLASTRNRSKMFQGLLGQRCPSASILSTSSARKRLVKRESETTQPTSSLLRWSVSTSTTIVLSRMTPAEKASKAFERTQRKRPEALGGKFKVADLM
mmetsp:Transcript_53092/g.164520  ORF Transcript_53092/g.164520 Transcript_53092/m.164520 type:complete len:221 (-) Transcript_53092:289-951(-)